ncbi:PIF1-like helicase [Medicago truncatula]|uniref:ATP-dependent DNA helicase n=1 Tax=Medicago truncatula TaxID=3880 RepID=G7KFV6_MEDTR|nr:PIF1-like helicase [Medicago truncatula]
MTEIEALLQVHGKSMKEHYPTMPRSDLSFNNEGQNRLIYDELRYDRNILKNEHKRLMSTMTLEQKTIYDKIMSRVVSNQPGFFFLYGYGGTGKTFIWRALSSTLHSNGEIVLIVASSGIAALLIPGGRTAHSRICIPFMVDECSTCTIKPKSSLAQLIIRAKLLIWDEAPIMHKHCFEVVDRNRSSHSRFCIPFHNRSSHMGSYMLQYHVLHQGMV